LSRYPSILEQIGRTPLVRLARLAEGLPVPVLAKCEHLNPSGSVKDRIALAIVDDAERRGLLRPGGTLIEATAGNTGLGLALVAARRGYGLVCVLPEKMSMDKRRALAAVGAQVIITANAPPDDERHFQNVARRLADEHGWFLTDQFRNPVGVDIHEQTTGPEILEQAGRVSAFVAGVGTGGTITGVGRFLKRRDASVRIVLADPAGSGLAGLVRTGRMGQDAPYLVEGIGTSRAPEVFDPGIVDEAEVVSDEESFATARRLQAQEGLLVGGSSGTIVAAALRVAARAAPGDGPVVALLPDSWDRYLTSPWMA
jgi:cysteine synthase